MPALTVNTTPPATTGTPTATGAATTTPPNDRSNTNSHSRSSSPVRPPYSPITPTLGPARLATAASTSTSPRTQDGASSATAATNTQPTRIYTHSQPNQTSMPQPAPERIAFGSNPDALALKSAISILQIQQRKAVGDIQNLQRIKERAMEDPEGFAKALAAGKVKIRSDPLFAPSGMDEEEDEDGEDGEAYSNGNEDARIPGTSTARTEDTAAAWPVIPTPQNVVRCPPINWTQYAVVGDSLDKLHADQQARPTDGVPAKPGPDGSLLVFGEGPRRLSEVVVAAPYTPGKDRIEKSKKGGKR
ncbi:hypothetical protein B7463_g6281, partial [Scytalidium lignicola]